jgi:hypothetical protein
MVNSFHPGIRAALRQVPALRWVKSFLDMKYYQRRRDRNFATRRAASRRREQVDWERALQDELGFWRWSLEQGHFTDRLDPHRPLQPELAGLLEQGVRGSCEALVVDVGSGPLTTVGCTWARPLRVMAIDPLADHYNALMDRLGVVPPVRPVMGAAENLLSVISAESADLLVMNNALDHSFQPLQCVMNLVAAAKPGCFVYLNHFANEAERESYRGLHQWNIFRRGNDTIVSSVTEEHSLAQVLTGKARVSTRTRFEKHAVVETVIRKLS